MTNPVATRQPWRDHAACIGRPTIWFFANERHVELIEAALTTCRRCPVRLECLEDALAFEVGDRVVFGVRGGCSPSYGPSWLSAGSGGWRAGAGDNLRSVRPTRRGLRRGDLRPAATAAAERQLATRDDTSVTQRVGKEGVTAGRADTRKHQVNPGFRQLSQVAKSALIVSRLQADPPSPKRSNT